MRPYLQKANTMSTTPDAPAETQKEESGGHGNLTYFIIGAIVAAIALALILPEVLEQRTALTVFHGIAIGGEVFLRALMMMVVPLVVASVMSGILGLGDVRKLGKPGFTAVGYYLSTTVLAVVVGLIWVNILEPGKNTDTEAAAVASTETESEQPDSTAENEEGEKQEAIVTTEDKTSLLERLEEQTSLDKYKLAKLFPQLKEGLPGEEPNIGMIMGNLVLMLFADNLLGAAVETNLLPLIVFGIIFAGMLTTMGDRVNSITSMIAQINEAMMNFVLLLMNVAPIGIFCLVASKFGIAQAEGNFTAVVQRTSLFIGTVLAGLGTHAFVTLPLIYWFFTRKNPYVYMKSMSRALLTAFSTASSSATLPVTMDAANEAGVSKRSTDFVLPLGATINMDGTALYEAAAAIFIANITPGYELTFINQIIIAVTATLAAIGAAGIPEAGLVTMLIVLNAVGLPVEGISAILAIDWLLDRFRTATNTFGDACGAAIVDKSFEGS
jgi:Na+/H+-dicarboxylate symporter